MELIIDEMDAIRGNNYRQKISKYSPRRANAMTLYDKRKTGQLRQFQYLRGIVIDNRRNKNVYPW
jgi:hypothetical protein